MWGEEPRVRLSQLSKEQQQNKALAALAVSRQCCSTVYFQLATNWFSCFGLNGNKMLQIFTCIKNFMTIWHSPKMAGN